MDALSQQVLLGVGDGARFGGAASVLLWGAVVLNPVLVKDRADLAEALAHETAHALLFGLVLGANLTLNDPAERFASPLRSDPRPIEGLVHAVYVLARIVWTLRRLAASDALTATERGRAADKINRNLARFHDGLSTVNAHARFTRVGTEISAECRRAMAVL